MHALPRRRGADGLRGEAIGRPNRRGPRPIMKPAGALAVPLQAVCGGARRRAGTDACRVRAMRRISPSCGQARSCWVFSRRNGGTRTRGLAAPSRARCQLRHIPKPSPSSLGAEAPMGQKGGWRRRTPAGTRTRIDGFGDRRARHCTTDAKGGVHNAARLAARSSGRQASRTPPESPEPDSNRRPAAYEAAALPLGHRGLDGPSHRFFQCMKSVRTGALSGAPREEPSGGAGGIRTRDLPVANGMRCLCATAPCRSPPMREPAGKGVIRVAALRRWCPRPDSNRRRPP